MKEHVTREELKKIVNKLIVEIGHIESDDCEFEGKNMFGDLDFDSISIIELITAIEDEINMDIPPELLVDCMNEYDTIIDCIDGLLIKG